MANQKELETILKALANKRRMDIVRAVRKEKELCVGDIAEKISLSFRSTSRHLNMLERVNILDKEQRGVQMFYRISKDLPEVSRKIIGLL